MIVVVNQFRVFSKQKRNWWNLHWNTGKKDFRVNPLTPRNLLFYGQNPNVWPFIGKPLNNTLPWCCLFFNFTQCVILENLSVLILALSGMKGLISLQCLSIGTTPDILVCSYPWMLPCYRITEVDTSLVCRIQERLLFHRLMSCHSLPKEALDHPVALSERFDSLCSYVLSTVLRK